MRSIHTAIIVAAALGTSPAFASDFAWKGQSAPVYAPWNWTGFYVGGSVGYGIDTQQATNNVGPLGDLDPAFFTLLSGGTSVGTSSSFQSRFKSVLGGPQIGFNWQSGALVAGLEADVSFGNLKKDAGSSTIIALDGPLSATGAANFNLNPGDVISLHESSVFAAHHDIGTFGTVRGRLGFTWDRYFFYATGGAAFADLKTSATVTGSASASANLLAANPSFAAVLPILNVSASANISKFVVGSAVGGGVEAYVAPNWSVKAEYLYISLPKQTISVGGDSATFSNNFHIARAGINYHF